MTALLLAPGPAAKELVQAKMFTTKLLLLSCITLVSGCKRLSKVENHAFHRKAKFYCSMP